MFSFQILNYLIRRPSLRSPWEFFVKLLHFNFSTFLPLYDSMLLHSWRRNRWCLHVSKFFSLFFFCNIRWLAESNKWRHLTSLADLSICGLALLSRENLNLDLNLLFCILNGDRLVLLYSCICRRISWFEQSNDHATAFLRLFFSWRHSASPRFSIRFLRLGKFIAACLVHYAYESFHVF